MIFLGVEDVLPIITASNDVIKPALKLKPQPSSHNCPSFYSDGKAKSISNRNFAGLTPICVDLCVDLQNYWGQTCVSAIHKPPYNKLTT